IKVVFKLDNIKGLFFLVLLPNTIDYIINNLSTKKVIFFINVKPKILNLGLKYSLNNINTFFLTIRILT
ncbi:hypothetical protein BDU57DRAFT_451120, partial [Ampelomyces quisqualis]